MKLKIKIKPTRYGSVSAAQTFAEQLVGKHIPFRFDILGNDHAHFWVEPGKEVQHQIDVFKSVYGDNMVSTSHVVDGSVNPDGF